MKIKINNILLVASKICFFTILFAACNSQNNSCDNQTPKHSLPYDFCATDKWELPSDLLEISGISFINNNLIACVQDERGSIFIYDLENKDIVNEIKFTKKGDYEDIVIDSTTVYVLRSDGDIFEISDYSTLNISVAKHETILKQKNDLEGMCLLNKEKALLLACKGESSTDSFKVENHQRAVYIFDLTSRTINKEPFLIIDSLEIANFLLKNYADIKFETMFQPSCIAIHPKTNDIYIISSVSKLLIVYSPDKKLKDAVELDKKTFKQPEGMCFSSLADLYISNEGRKGKANIICLKYRE